MVSAAVVTFKQGVRVKDTQKVAGPHSKNPQHHMREHCCGSQPSSRANTPAATLSSSSSPSAALHTRIVTNLFDCHFIKDSGASLAAATASLPNMATAAVAADGEDTNNKAGDQRPPKHKGKVGCICNRTCTQPSAQQRSKQQQQQQFYC